MNIMSQFQQFMNNPMGYLASRNINIPQEYISDPNECIQYLMNTGKISQQDYNKANEMAKQFMKQFK